MFDADARYIDRIWPNMARPPGRSKKLRLQRAIFAESAMVTANATACRAGFRDSLALAPPCGENVSVP
jgi:hypothetical protein